MSRSKRKLEHISHALQTGQTRSSGFDDIMFLHQSLPNIDVEDVSLTTSIGELVLSSPLFINAMTGGGGKGTEMINSQLAEIANHFGLPMAVGSQMSAIRNPLEAASFKIVRKKHPNGILFANIGSEATVDQAKKCVDMIEADALQIHLNVIQELVMPEGDRNFHGALDRIELISKELSVPVIVKEVGYGMNKETVVKLYNAGVSIVDIGGFGGTNFSKIEDKRREKSLSIFHEWGIPTVVSIAEAKHSPFPVTVIGSGGIQTSLDIAKSIALGANAAGMAGNILRIAKEDGVEGAVTYIEDVLEELKMIMTAVGAKKINDLQKAPLLIFNRTKEWLEMREISLSMYSNRQIPD
ncbi:type 2 isopentenyl-diphosphate Delta-isomerase [Evansella sp. AB-rgal1]|uniref:type 2 isopentenyl-diphosphate Delta-isomerase n=1 Tax=Evansella sp. AB-rgal1 TaxID=3242696 RepID=UPI00359E5C85